MFEKTKAELAEAAVADVGLLPAVVLADEMTELREIELVAAVQRLRRLDAFDRVEGYTDDGQLTAAAWLRNNLGMTHAAATADVSVARVRRTCPQLSAAHDAQRTSFRHLQVAAAAMRRLAKPEIWTALDSRLTGWAQETTVQTFAQMLDELVTQLRPEPKPKDETQREQRRLSVGSGFDGMVNVSGRLTPEVGEKLHAALSAASRPDVDGELRTSGQRKADALDHVLDTVLDTALLPVDGGEKPHVTVTVDLDQLADQPDGACVSDQDDGPCDSGRSAGSLWGETPEQQYQRMTAAAAAAEALDSRPRYSWTGPASSADARRLACDGIIQPIFTRGGKPIDVGRRTRVIGAPLRAFIVARDRDCVAPGCGMPARWCQVHHVQHWRDGGRTDRSNLVLICEAHHRAAHNGQWTVVLHGPGTISYRPRRSGDPYYDIRPGPPATAPAVDEQPPLHDLLTAAARHLRSG